MEKFTQRFPNKEMGMRVFWVVAFPINMWAIINTLRELPGFFLYMNTGQIISYVAYTMTFALIEICGMWLVMCIACVIFPHRWYRDQFVEMSTAIVIILAIWFIPAQFFDKIRGVDFPPPLLILAFWIITLISALILFRPLIQNSNRVSNFLNRLTDRIAILSMIYFVFNMLGVFVVALRITGLWGNI